jgi:hypothetical protein
MGTRQSRLEAAPTNPQLPFGRLAISDCLEKPLSTYQGPEDSRFWLSPGLVFFNNGCASGTFGLEKGFLPYDMI